MEDLIVNNLSTFGPLAVFVLLMLSGLGIPLGEDVVNIPAGMLIAAGTLPLWPTLACAYFGVVLADFVWFKICWHYGKPLLHTRWFKRSFHPRRLLQVKHQIEQRGVWVIVMARFIPGSRSPAITMAGMLHMPFWKFAMAEVCCVAVTAPMQIAIGYYTARELQGAGIIEGLLKVLAAAAVVAAVVMAVRWWWRWSAEGGPLPRAKARWLRRHRRRRPDDCPTPAQVGNPAGADGPREGAPEADDPVRRSAASERERVASAGPVPRGE